MKSLIASAVFVDRRSEGSRRGVPDGGRPAWWSHEER